MKRQDHANACSYGFAKERDYDAALAATLVSMIFRIRRRVRSTEASVSARQLSISTPTP